MAFIPASRNLPASSTKMPCHPHQSADGRSKDTVPKFILAAQHADIVPTLFNFRDARYANSP